MDLLSLLTIVDICSGGPSTVEYMKQGTGKEHRAQAAAGMQGQRAHPNGMLCRIVLRGSPHEGNRRLVIGSDGVGAGRMADLYLTPDQPAHARSSTATLPSDITCACLFSLRE